MAGTASIADVGALAWMMLRSVVPATAFALFVEDERQDVLAVAHAAGAHAPMLRQLKRPRGGGIAGWVAVNRRGVVNADPALDLGLGAATIEPPLRSALAVPLFQNGRSIGVLRATPRRRRPSPTTICGCSKCSRRAWPRRWPPRPRAPKQFRCSAPPAAHAEH